MPLPPLNAKGTLLPGLHTAPLSEIETRFGSGSEVRIRQFGLLSAVITAARDYPTLKRVLVWGSFVTSKPEPNDLDYSVIVAVDHDRVDVKPEHRRFFVPHDARMFYGVDKGFLVIKDYPLDEYIERVDFLCHDRRDKESGVVEINLYGEFTGGVE